MSAIRLAVAGYLSLRRSLGFKLEEPGWLLLDFARSLERAGATHITVQAAMEWATAPAGATSYYYWLRLSAVRGLAAHLHAIDPRHQVLPRGLLPRNYHRPLPCLFTDEEIAALMAACQTLRGALQAATFQALIGLLAVTAMRPGEAINLDREHVDLHEAVITVLDGKGGISRILMLQPSSVAALAGYAELRDRLCPDPEGPGFFVSTAGTRLRHNRLNIVFPKLARIAGLTPRPAGCRPRPMDLRHTFAVSTLIDWYRAGADVDALMPVLSTWLGHSKPESNYWYISASPELLALAAGRLRHAQEQLP